MTLESDPNNIAGYITSLSVSQLRITLLRLSLGGFLVGDVSLR